MLFRSRPVPPKFWYNDDREGVVGLFRTLVPFARAHATEYVYYAGVDFGWAVGDEDRTKINESIRTNRDMDLAFQDGDATVYRVALPTTAYTNPPASTITNPGQVVAGR